MRTTIRLDDHLMADVKRFAAETHRTVTRVIEDALREALARRRAGALGEKRKKITFPTSSGKLIAPIDLSNNEQVRDFMDFENGPPGR